MTRGAVVRLRCTSAAAAAVVALRALVASSAINEPCRRRLASRLAPPRAMPITTRQTRLTTQTLLR